MNDYNLQANNSIRADLLSKTITFLKFPLAVLVVVLHCDLSTKPFERIGISFEEITDPVYANISWFLSRYIAYAAVPCFFVISGFLLFYNIQAYDRSIYLTKLKKRCKSLLVPYISWCLIYLFLYWIIGQNNIVFSEVPNLFDNTLSPLEFLIAVFIKPLDGPLWFIRNLFVMVVLSPILYFIIKRTKFFLPILLLILTNVVHSSIIESFLWFSFGISFAVQRIDFLYFCNKYLCFSCIIVIITVVMDLFLYPKINLHITGYFTIFKIVTVFGLGYWLVKKYPQITQNKLLNNSSFTIYAYHGLALFIFLPLIYKLTNRIGGLIVTYLLTICIIVIIGLALSVVINKNKIIRTILSGR